jgi:hypothetical protein
MFTLVLRVSGNHATTGLISNLAAPTILFERASS